jgi:CubicO group peptidase (beta-lactamase class C family)
MRRPFVVVLALLLAAPVSYARRRAVAHLASFTLPQLDAIAAGALEAGVPGLTISVSKNGSSVTRSWGNTRNDSVYQIGSVTKQFTAAAIMRLVEAGTLRVEDKARTWLPELDARFDAITIQHLLTHRSGVADYNSQLASAWEPKTQSQIVALITRSGPLFTPGTRYVYSNSGYYLLGMIVERASSKTYEQFLRETFFEPLALRNTSYCGTTAPSPDGYAIDIDGKVYDAPAADMSLPYAAGALCSTADDLVRWTDALHHGRVVSAQSYARMTAPSGVAYGFALALDPLDGRRRIWHGGSILGFETSVMYCPDEELTVVVLTNAIDLRTEHRATEIADAVARAAK